MNPMNQMDQMDRMTSMNSNTLKDVINIDREISNNIGEKLHKANLESKQGNKISKLKDKIDQGTVVLKTMNLNDSYDESMDKLKTLLGIIYSASHLEKQLIRVLKYNEVIDLVTHGYNVITSRQDAYDKAVYRLNDELEQ